MSKPTLNAKPVALGCTTFGELRRGQKFRYHKRPPKWATDETVMTKTGKDRAEVHMPIKGGTSHIIAIVRNEQKVVVV